MLVPGAQLDDLVAAYYKVAPPEVIDGRTLAEFMEDAHRRRSGSEVTEVVRHLGNALAADDRLPDGRRRCHQFPA